MTLATRPYEYHKFQFEYCGNWRLNWEEEGALRDYLHGMIERNLYFQAKFGMQSDEPHGSDRKSLPKQLL